MVLKKHMMALTSLSTIIKYSLITNSENNNDTDGFCKTHDFS